MSVSRKRTFTMVAVMGLLAALILYWIGQTTVATEFATLLVGYVLGSLVGLPLLRDLGRWLSLSAHHRPDWDDR